MTGRQWALAAVVVLLIFGVPVALNSPRGIRNKNPGNLRPLPRDKWLGELSPDLAKGGPFSRFEYPWQGWRAMGIDVFGDILNDGLNTIARLVHEYAPGSDSNNETEYIAVLSKALGITPTTPINVKKQGAALLRAITKHEQGIDPDLVWGAAEREKGVTQALQRFNV